MAVGAKRAGTNSKAESGRGCQRSHLDEDWDRMLEFRYASSDRFEQELTAHLLEYIRARLWTLTTMATRRSPGRWTTSGAPAVNGDFVTGETGVWGFQRADGVNVEFYVRRRRAARAGGHATGVRCTMTKPPAR